MNGGGIFSKVCLIQILLCQSKEMDGELGKYVRKCPFTFPGNKVIIIGI